MVCPTGALFPTKGRPRWRRSHEIPASWSPCCGPVSGRAQGARHELPLSQHYRPAQQAKLRSGHRSGLAGCSGLPHVVPYLDEWLIELATLCMDMVFSPVASDQQRSTPKTWISAWWREDVANK